MFATLFSGYLFAQNQKTGGVILDKETNEPLIGATVLLKGGIE